MQTFFKLPERAFRKRFGKTGMPLVHNKKKNRHAPICSFRPPQDNKENDKK